MRDGVTTDVMERLRGASTSHPYPLVFATMSGAHLYGFPSRDSDYDLRGCHVLPVREVLGLEVGRETIETSAQDGDFGTEIVVLGVQQSPGFSPWNPRRFNGGGGNDFSTSVMS